MALARTPAAATGAESGWHGGTVTAATGEHVTIYVSDALTEQQVSPQKWADFFARLIHGSELSRVTVWIAAQGELQQMCGADAAGCYDPGTESIYMPGDVPESELVAAHEYAHHIERNRLNPPWLSDTYGPKLWATEEGICDRAAHGSVFPGNESDFYTLNPGEGFAEAYRALNDTKNGVAFTWPIVSWSFYPDQAALAAAEADVVNPWTGATTTVVQRRLTRTVHQVALRLATHLDGSLEITSTVNRSIPIDLSLIDPVSKKVVARGVWVGRQVRQLRYTICSQRAFTVRVASHGVARVTVRMSVP